MPEWFDSSTANLFVFFAIVAGVAAVAALVLAAVFAWRDTHPKYTVRRGVKTEEVDTAETVRL